MNILTYIPMPMPIVVHGGGGSVVAPHYTGVCLLAAVFFGALAILSLCCGIACIVFDKDEDTPMEATVIFLCIGMLFVTASLICCIFGV
jgi:hypothetical protein